MITDSKTTNVQTDKATSERETIRNYRLAGKSFHWIARTCKRSLGFITQACEGIPLGEKGTNYRIGRYLGNNPTATNEQASAVLGFPVALIAQRRRLMIRKPTREYVRPPVDSDKVDNGKRLSLQWMRANCSRGQRTIWQVQAVVNAASCPLSLVEIVRSAESAGLIVDKRTGLIRSPDVASRSSQQLRPER